MAFQDLGKTISRPAAADLSTHQFKFMKINSSAQAALCSVLGERIVGVLQDKPSAAGKAGSLMVGAGVTKITLGATLAAGASVTTSAAGVAVATQAGHYQAGILLEGGDATHIVSMVLTPGGFANVDAMVGRTITVLAAADYTAEVYPPVYIDTSGKAATQTTGAGAVNGILQNQPDADENAIVMVSGVSKVVLGATLTAGVEVMVEATDRKLIAETGDCTVVGTLLEGGDEDDQVDCLIQIGNLGHQHA